MIAAMDKEGVHRFVGISADPVAPDSAKPFMDRSVICPLLYRFFGESYDDMRAMERLLAGNARVVRSSAGTQCGGASARR